MTPTLIHRALTGLSRLALALWVGSTLAIGYLVAPVLFQQLPDRALAGQVAGVLFTAQAWIALSCGGVLLMAARQGWRGCLLCQPRVRLIVAMLALVLLGHFGLQPFMAELKQAAQPLPVMESSFRERFALLHGVSSLLYLVQSLLGIWLVWLGESDD